MTNLTKFTERDIPDLSGYVAIVTGGNSGIGYETANQLALHNARVYIASRSQARVQEAIDTMAKAANKTLDVRFLQLDLQDLKSVKQAAADFTSKEPKLDILINNAGVMTVPYKLTGDGFETQWQVNYLAPHIFTTSLMPSLLSAASAANDKTRVRVVNLSSDLAVVAPGGPRKIQEDVNMTSAKGVFELMHRYAHSKQASIRDAAEINKRYSAQGVTAYSVHPGIVNTNLQNHDNTWLGFIVRNLLKVVARTTPLQGSYNSLFAATSPAAPAHAQGKFLMPVAKIDSRASTWLEEDKDNADLWEKSEAKSKEIA
ncbi:hypothetical protein B0I35DRAFT_438069 [Stachybotrys elegans]|uniref:NAD(P)-binding protein n=1 Tax=Stachybotrys elegans TaxID=80388 RepID=A0A8K0SLC7_9HYPO|nr:hypothetical protein B0I35DRAFT_438069 [Stachybotrys elegans]